LRLALNQPKLTRWLWIVGGLLTLAGYFGPWIDHPASGLVITGLDLGEYVKFLPQIRSSQISLWREGFYLPLVTVSLAFSLQLFRAEWHYHWLLRAFLIACAIVAALNMLPPAWTPERMMTPEFRWQAVAIAICLGAMTISPFLALLPRWLGQISITILAILALWYPIRNFLQILEPISELYNQPQRPGWGLYVMAVGLIMFIILSLKVKEAFVSNEYKYHR